MIFDSFIFEENNSYYVDLSQIDFKVELNDVIRFNHQQKKFLGKIKYKVQNTDEIYSIEIIKEIV